MTNWQIITGDCRDVLATLPAASVHTCVTSPPYFGLRDYGHDGQIGLEPTPDEFVAALVAVFREVRRVLRDDGTVFLNLGDSYASTPPGNPGAMQARNGAGFRGVVHEERSGHRGIPAGYKAKDLLGIPWMVAFALRQPWYAGKITNELDRVWLAAMIDAEGCIYVHRRPAGASNGQGYVRKADSFGSGLEVANTNLRVVERCMEITGRGSISRQEKDRRQPLYRWCLRTNECREVLREVYSYLVAKQHEARIACGVPSSGPSATAAWEALKLLHGGSDTTVDFKPPESLHTPGWYLRSDVIWSKLNPMPESVTDRPTKAHEYVFLLSKGPRYFYDADAIREDSIKVANGDPMLSWDERKALGEGPRRGESHNAPKAALNTLAANPAGRNKRSVWTVATQPYAGAHFATFPPKLIEPCILAGAPERACGECGAPWVRVVEKGPPAPEPNGRNPAKRLEPGQAGNVGAGNMGFRASRLSGQEMAAWREAHPDRTVGFEPSCSHDADACAGVVLDPFAGAGTTGMVALRHGRSFVGIELSPAYAEMARRRIVDDAPLLNSVAEIEFPTLEEARSEHARAVIERQDGCA